jgi:adenylate cyclase class 2
MKRHGDDTTKKQGAGGLMAGNGENLEVEVKFWLPALAEVVERLTAVGATLQKPRVYERNVRFDFADNGLQKHLQMIRLREDTAVRLTFKGPSTADAASEARVREEIEVAVADFAPMALILQRLGLQPVQKYEKYRQTWQWNDVEIVLDELPFGNFVELEGSETAIKAAAAQLGLDWRERILANYLWIMQLAQETFRLPFTDLTFTNFADRSIDLEPIVRRLMPGESTHGT